jgi:hypothetical protein
MFEVIIVVLLLLIIYQMVLEDKSVNSNLPNLLAFMKLKNHSSSVPSQKYTDSEIDKLKKELKKQKKESEELLKVQRDMAERLQLEIEDPLQDINFLYDSNQCEGDDELTRKMIHTSLKNKHAINNRAKWDVNSFRPYVEEELNEHANSIWWDNQDLENEFY